MNLAQFLEGREENTYLVAADGTLVPFDEWRHWVSVKCPVGGSPK